MRLLMVQVAIPSVSRKKRRPEQHAFHYYKMEHLTKSLRIRGLVWSLDMVVTVDTISGASAN